MLLGNTSQRELNRTDQENREYEQQIAGERGRGATTGIGNQDDCPPQSDDGTGDDRRGGRTAVVIDHIAATARTKRKATASYNGTADRTTLMAVAEDAQNMTATISAR